MSYAGVAFGSPNPAIGQSFGYNDRNELTGSDRDDTGPVDWTYVYDNIGNRETFTLGDEPAMEYTANLVNQYERTDRVGGTQSRMGYGYDADGNLVESWLAGDMNP